MSSTGTDNNSTNRRKKRFHSKTTTGCSTCRARRVKCDETKPSCIRCLRTGRSCPGYNIQITWAQPVKSSSDRNSSPSIIPSKLTTYQSSDEARNLAFFIKRSAPMVSMASGGSDLWTVILPQVSWTYPELREMVYAFSCLDQHFMSSATTNAIKGRMRFALQHYNKAISGLTHGTPALHNILLSSIIGWMFEITTCNFQKAKIHILGAQNLVKQFDEIDRSKGRSPRQDMVVEAVRSLPLGPHWKAEKTSGCDPAPEELPEINSLEDAWTTLEDSMQDLRRPDIDIETLNRGQRAMRLWQNAFIDNRFRLSGDAEVPMSAKRPIVLLHKIGLVCLELHKNHLTGSSISGRRKHWETVLNNSEYILEFGYGPRIDNGVAMLLDIIVGHAHSDREIFQRACKLRQRLRMN